MLRAVFIGDGQQFEHPVLLRLARRFGHGPSKWQLCVRLWWWRPELCAWSRKVPAVHQWSSAPRLVCSGVSLWKPVPCACSPSMCSGLAGGCFVRKRVPFLWAAWCLINFQPHPAPWFLPLMPLIAEPGLQEGLSAFLAVLSPVECCFQSCAWGEP